jgi:arylsulfatase A-like enzyme
MTDSRGPAPVPPSHWGAVDTLLAAAGIGFVAGAAESVVHAVRQHVRHRTLFMSPDYPWQLPLADGLVFLVLGLVFLALTAPKPSLRTPKLVIGLFGTLAALAVLLLFEQIHIAAEAILALGIGLVMARALGTPGRRVPRLLRVAVPVALVLILGLAGVMRLAGARAERNALAALPAAEPGRPNILLLVLDTVRAWSMGLYGYGRPTTPKLAGWAGQGVVFERALAPAPWTTLSHAVMFTGRYPIDLSVGWDRPLDGVFPTLAEALGRAGYATGGFVANYTQAGRPTGLARGFAHFEDYPLQAVPILRRLGLFRRLAGIDRVARLVGRRRMVEGKIGETVTQEFLRWETRQTGRPWFAFLNYYDAHGPYLPPAPFDTMYFSGTAPAVERYWEMLRRAYGPTPVPVQDLAISLDAYDGGITYLDTQVDVLLRTLAERGALSNTIVVITSDHGELFGEHGVIAHGNNLYLPVLHVPLVLIAPGRAPGGLRIASIASLRDLPATLLEMARVSNPGLPGRSLARSWGPPEAAVAPDTALALVEYNRRLPTYLAAAPVLRGSMRSVVLDSLQYILNGDGQEELYHLGRDSWQIRNLVAAPQYQADLARYRNAMRATAAREGWVPVPQ